MENEDEAEKNMVYQKASQHNPVYQKLKTYHKAHDSIYFFLKKVANRIIIKLIVQ
ncbi:hypothetical protein HMPREF3212_04108 [Citrobacter freundii]|nr:hypothetical protein HMPREF3212_04108 [Citrobacter freundii]